jgi:glutathione S-transferase
MTPTPPRLFTFGISHFCEKARWALDWHGLPYIEENWAVGAHGILAKLYGASATTLPILLDGKTVVQGSGDIIDWADRNGRMRERGLAADDAREIERRADALIGVHVRRLAYAAMLPTRAHVVKAELSRGLSATQRVVCSLMWPVSRLMMMRAMDITPEAASESRAILETELDWLDSQIADGRPHLAGDRFSRADITVASLLAPLARPKEMPVFHTMPVPASLMADHERWRERPVMHFVAAQYRHRHQRQVSACAG